MLKSNPRGKGNPKLDSPQLPNHMICGQLAPSEALAIAERIRVAVESSELSLGDDSALSLTLSIGVATCPDHGLDRDRFIEAADRAMFHAKASGRNCVISVEDLS